MEYLINADDFGRTRNTNKAILEGFELGYIDRTSIIVNTGAYYEAVKLAHSHGFYSQIGLHFNIITGVPLTEDIKHCKGFCNENGRFNANIFRSNRMKLFLLPKERKAVKKELAAQISKYKCDNFPLMHFDSHGHVHTFASLMPLCFHMVKKENFKSIRLTLNYSISGLKGIAKIFENYIFNKLNRKSNRACLYFDSIQTAIKTFESIKDTPGIFEVMIHPDYYDGIHRQIELRHTYKDLQLFDSYRIKKQISDK